MKTGVSANDMKITFQQATLAPAELQDATASLLPMCEFNALTFISQVVPV